MKTKNGTAQRLGRPRDSRADRAIIAATLELVAEAGVQDFRMDDVAERAGVGKAAIYRRYRSKDDLVAATVAALVSEIEVPDTGSTREDLVELMREAVQVYSDPVRSGVIASVVGSMRLHPELTRTVREGFLAGRRAALSVVLDRGIARGDLASGLDVELALDALGGALFYRLLITGGPIDEHLAEGVAELILRGFAPLKEQS
ncbi:MAG: TetR/AcrR family transcriptional regulator [Thermoleophilaceae bacterium]|jgi:AcrR family transcriptional regulator